MEIWFEIAIILLLVLLNGIFAMSELAIVSARRGRLMAMERRGSPGASAALALAEDPQRFLPTVQVGISLVGILAGVFGGARLAGPLGEMLARIPLSPLRHRGRLRPGGGRHRLCQPDPRRAGAQATGAA